MSRERQSSLMSWILVYRRFFVCTSHRCMCCPQVPRIKADASARVARGLADAYEALYQILTDPQHGYTSATEASEAVKHTPLHVRTILGVVT